MERIIILSIDCGQKGVYAKLWSAFTMYLLLFSDLVERRLWLKNEKSLMLFQHMLIIMMMVPLFYNNYHSFQYYMNKQGIRVIS